MEGLQVFLLNNKSLFANIHLLQTNGTATGAPNSCSYSDIVISHPDKIINGKRTIQSQECFYFGRYHDDCLVLYCSDVKEINNFHKMLNTLNEKLKFTMDNRASSICF